MLSTIFKQYPVLLLLLLLPLMTACNTTNRLPVFPGVAVVTAPPANLSVEIRACDTFAVVNVGGYVGKGLDLVNVALCKDDTSDAAD